MGVTGVVERLMMNLVARLKKRREQLAQWDSERILGFSRIPARTMLQISRGINREVQHYNPPGLKEFQLNFIDKIWAIRLWIELNVQLMR
jgi:hypothetical protein